ncbi:putative ahpC/TSA antioxidant enzyme [Lyophyllum shimeji]|uniref:AhpC/TSA antioxidant enzyme n=1 Tax=Lyophyllum shimeji TaxID=47721 RepID=A0A9P3PY93_LYOSH|nr:putative ahpC/TSA antioxidant enzyme [Lyophyllum shimeji]
MSTSTASTDTSIPNQETIAKASKLEIFDGEGNKVAFGSLFESQKTIVVFVRHFFCGSCQAYVEGLASVPKEPLEKANVSITVIGCGEWEPIKSYAESTRFHGPIYADPSRALYHTLGMTVENLSGTPAGQERRSYLTKNPIVNAMQSIWRGPLKHPSLIGKQGNISQLGGEFVFGPGLQCTFASRMKHTEDHVEIADLLKNAGVEVA